MKLPNYITLVSVQLFNEHIFQLMYTFMNMYNLNMILVLKHESLYPITYTLANQWCYIIVRHICLLNSQKYFAEPRNKTNAPQLCPIELNKRHLIFKTHICSSGCPLLLPELVYMQI